MIQSGRSAEGSVHWGRTRGTGHFDMYICVLFCLYSAACINLLILLYKFDVLVLIYLCLVVRSVKLLSG